MGAGEILARAWAITRRYTGLWILGLMVVGLGSGNVDLTLPPVLDTTAGEGVQVFSAQAVMGLLFVAGVLAVFGIGFWVLGAIARGALIIAVDRVERGQEFSLMAAWNGGTAVFGRLFLIGLPVAFPALLLTFTAYAGSLTAQASGEAVSGVMTLVLALLIGALAAISLVLTLVQQFADRAAVLEDLGPLDAIQRGWRVLGMNRERLRRLIGVWAVLTVLVRLLITLPTSGLILPVLFAVVAGGPLGNGLLPLLCVTIFGLVIAFVLFALVSVLLSAMWTVAYRSCLGLVTVETDPAPAPDEA